MTTTNNNKIRYSNCWEDADLLIAVLDIQTSDTVLSIASGGCNSLSISARTSEKVYVIDSNPAQIYITQLKYFAANKLTHSQYLEFIGVRKSPKRLDYYNSLCELLPKSCRSYFDTNLSFLSTGIIHCGKFDTYLRVFRKYILPFVESKKTIHKLLTANNKADQYDIFYKEWNNRRWKILGKLFFGKPIMKFGRQKKMFDFNRHKSVGKTILNRAETFLSQGIVNPNPYLELILTGTFQKSFPDYLRESIYYSIKTSDNLEFIHEDILIFLKNKPDKSIDKYNLSDIFESINTVISDQIFGEILRTAKPNARLIFWNNMVVRDIPKALQKSFVFEQDLVSQYSNKELVFFYDKFYIYSIKK